MTGINARPSKDCIIYLIKNDPIHIKNFNESINSVALHLKNTLLNSKPDVILFFDNELSPSDLELPADIVFKFEKVDFDTLPNSLTQDQVAKYFPHPTHWAGPIGYGDPGFSIGYRHMCRFFSGQMYTHAALTEYEYYMRLDCDSLFLSEVKFDFFELVRERRLIYGYIAQGIQTDNEKVSFGFYEVAEKWLRKNGSFFEKSRKLFLAKKNRMFYTNFEIGHLPWFRSKKYRDFFSFIDSYNGFFNFRWGDAIVKYFAIRVLLPRRKYAPLRGFIYKHGAVYLNPQYPRVSKIARLLGSFLNRFTQKN